MSTRRSGNRRRRRTKKRKSGVLYWIVLVIAVGILVFSAIQLYFIFSEYHRGKAEYDNLKEVAVHTNDGGNPEDGTDVYIDFAALQKKNPDIIAWIRFIHPKEINYPVAQGEDNSEYLHKTFEANSNKLGTIFVDYQNDAHFTDDNTFLYGHNMDNGTMFAQLLKYKKESYYKKYPYFFIYTPDQKVFKYQICSTGIVKDVSDSYTQFFETDQDFQKYIDMILKISDYNTGAKVTTDDKIVSLSTCTNEVEDDRYLVHGVQIGEAETSKDKAKKTENGK